MGLSKSPESPALLYEKPVYGGEADSPWHEKPVYGGEADSPWHEKPVYGPEKSWKKLQTTENNWK